MDLHCPKPTRSTHAGNNSRQKKLEFCPAQVRFGGEELGWRSGCVPLAAGTTYYMSRGDGRRQLPVWLPLLSPHPTAGGAPTWHCGGWERLCTVQSHLEITGEQQESSPAMQSSLISRTSALDKTVHSHDEAVCCHFGRTDSFSAYSHPKALQGFWGLLPGCIVETAGID